jgi:hypothetical protein
MLSGSGIDDRGLSPAAALHMTLSASLGRLSSASTRLWCSIQSRVRGQIQPVTVRIEP